ncbi:MAG: hypothetical protein JSS09_06305 [Verrucomicrobia bacterium]|nr:hypothetical protein [Verrucomicrobiota bacterium]
MGEWVASSWIDKHGDMFKCFHDHLIKVSQNYDQLTELPLAVEESMAEASIKEFGALNTYIFSILNSVVFSEKKMKELRELAQKDKEKSVESQEKSSELSVEELKKNFEEQMQKVLEKQEKKILGITERYRMEIAGYRKQISQLQKKLEALCVKSG